MRGPYPVAILLGVLLMGLSTDAQAQLVRDAGVKVGLTSASATDTISDLDRRTGLRAMAFVEWLDAPLFSVVTELGYTQRGFSETAEQRDESGEVVQNVVANTRLDYVTGAVLAKVRYPSAGLMPYAMAGPRIDALMNREAGQFEWVGGSAESELASLYESTALGATVAAGVEVRRGLPFSVSVEGRYEHDLTDSTPHVPRTVRNNAFSLVLGVGF